MNIVRLATLNCLNLALAGRRTYEGWPAYTPDEYIAKTQWLASMIDRLAADFVLLQEVFHEAALADVVRQTAGRGHPLAFSAPLADDGNTRPRVALVWRRAAVKDAPQIESIERFPDGCAVALPEKGEATAFTRPVLRARVALAAGLPLTICNVHLKSRRPDFVAGEDPAEPAAEARAQLRSLIQRGAEAAALRRLVIESSRGPGSPLVVGGDFNGTPAEVTTQIVSDTSWVPDDRPRRDNMLFDVLDVEKRLEPGRGRDMAFTILRAGEPERIDHILVSEEFIAQSKHSLGRVTAVELLNDHVFERRRGIGAELRAPADAGGTDLTRIYSDHAALCASILIERTVAGST